MKPTNRVPEACQEHRAGRPGPSRQSVNSRFVGERSGSWPPTGSPWPGAPSAGPKVLMPPGWEASFVAPCGTPPAPMVPFSICDLETLQGLPSPPMFTSWGVLGIITHTFFSSTQNL
jgi:hypothetical protein